MESEQSNENEDELLVTAAAAAAVTLILVGIFRCSIVPQTGLVLVQTDEQSYFAVAEHLGHD